MSSMASTTRPRRLTTPYSRPSEGSVRQPGPSSSASTRTRRPSLPGHTPPGSEQTGTTFAEELARLAQAHGGTKVADVIRDVSERCRREAQKGFCSALIFYGDFVGDDEKVSAIHAELEILGLEVKRVERFRKDLIVEVVWPASIQDTSLGACRRDRGGNLELQCGVCMQDSVVARLHPCGHLMGVCCISQIVGEKCPFCRVKAVTTQVVYKP